jgi:UDP-glucose 4-epimerase
MTEMRSLVTGGAGFIGSHLIDRLLDDGHEVIAIDNFSTSRAKNLAHIKGKPRLNLNLIRADITDREAITPYFEGIDWVFHLAGLADIVPSIRHPLAYFRANVDGTVNVLEASRCAKIKRFIYAASSSCYGIPDIYPTPETAPIRPEYPYALTKYLGELCVLHWGKVYKLPVVSLRLFNVYGPRSRTSGTYGAVFGVFLAQKLNNKPFTVVGDGNQSRDFIFVTDAINAFIMAAQSNLKNEVLNVGSGHTYTVNHLVKLLGGKVVHVPKRPGEPDCTQADITKAKELLSWEPQISFEEGVEILLQNIDYWKEAPLWTPETISEATREWFECLSCTDTDRHWR